MQPQDCQGKKATNENEKADEPEPVRSLFLLRELRDAGECLAGLYFLKDFHIHQQHL